MTNSFGYLCMFEAYSSFRNPPTKTRVSINSFGQSRCRGYCYLKTQVATPSPFKARVAVGRYRLSSVLPALFQSVSLSSCFITLYISYTYTQLTATLTCINHTNNSTCTITMSYFNNTWISISCFT